AETGAGLRQLLRVFTQLMPSPLEGNPPEFIAGGEGKRVPIDPSDQDAHFIGHVFKVNVDPYVGRLAAFRVHQGRIRAGDQILVGDRRKAVKIAHLYRMQGKELEEIPRATPGELCAVAKIDQIRFDDVLHSSHDEDEVRLSPVGLPPPMYGLALEPAQHGQEKKLSDALHKITAEDPSLVVEHDAQANETVLRGMGELHLRLVLERIQDELGLELKTRPPKIAYRETVTRSAEGHHRHKKQTGGAGQFGEVFLRVEPLPRGTGFQFVDEVKGGTIPTQFIPAVEKGIHQVLAAGPLGGFPVQDLKVIVYDGKHHPVDSKGVAFITAGKRALLDAMMKAKPIILEPIVNIEISAPESAMGDIAGDLSAKRGQVSGTDSLPGGTIVVSGKAPLSELNNYQGRLKSVTGGQGSYAIELSHYDPVPPQVQQQIVASHKTAHEE